MSFASPIYHRHFQAILGWCNGILKAQRRGMVFSLMSVGDIRSKTVLVLVDPELRYGQICVTKRLLHGHLTSLSANREGAQWEYNSSQITQNLFSQEA